MSTYRSSYKTRRRRINVKLIVALIALVGVIGTIGLGTMNFSKAKKITKAGEKIETIKVETSNIEKQIPDLEKEVEDLGSEVEDLQNILWRYEPVIIPESMK